MDVFGGCTHTEAPNFRLGAKPSPQPPILASRPYPTVPAMKSELPLAFLLFSLCLKALLTYGYKLVGRVQQRLYFHLSSSS